MNRSTMWFYHYRWHDREHDMQSHPWSQFFVGQWNICLDGKANEPLPSDSLQVLLRCRIIGCWTSGSKGCGVLISCPWMSSLYYYSSYFLSKSLILELTYVLLSHGKWSQDRIFYVLIAILKRWWDFCWYQSMRKAWAIVILQQQVGTWWICRKTLFLHHMSQWTTNICNLAVSRCMSKGRYKNITDDPNKKTDTEMYVSNHTWFK